MGKHWMPSLAAQLAKAILAGVWTFHTRSHLHIPLTANVSQNWGRQTSSLGLPQTPRLGWLPLISVSFQHGAVGSCPKVRGHRLAQLALPWRRRGTSIHHLLCQLRTHHLHSTQVLGALVGKLRSTWRLTWMTATIFGRPSHQSCCFYQHIAGHQPWWFGWFEKTGGWATAGMQQRCPIWRGWVLCHGDRRDAGGSMLQACKFHPGECQRYPHVQSLCSVQIHCWSGPPCICAWVQYSVYRWAVHPQEKFGSKWWWESPCFNLNVDLHC